jgi:hypothetical protein
MSYVKGNALKTMPRIVKKYFGNQGLKHWLDSLSVAAFQIFSGKILVKKWYPLKIGLIEPTANYCILFYNWDFKGAWEMGRHSADFGLKGIHKIFLRIGSPEFLIKKASEILPAYYKPSTITILELKENLAVFEISNFPDLNKIIEYRIGGWMERALEISGCKNVELKILESVERTKSTSKIQATWKKTGR